jgi:hypothetical protein
VKGLSGQLANSELGPSSDPNPNEWNLLRDKFHALVREGSDSIEDIFDAQFRCRFSELIDRVAEPARVDGSESSPLPRGGF